MDAGEARTRESLRATVVALPLPQKQPQLNKELKTGSAMVKLNKLQFLRLVDIKLREVPPPPEEPKEPETKKTPESGSSKAYEWKELKGKELKLKRNHLREALESYQKSLENQEMQEIEERRKQVEQELLRQENPEVARLERELEDMMRQGASTRQMERVQKELWKLRNRARDPKKALGELEDSPLYGILQLKEVSVPQLKTPVTLGFLAKRLLSDRDRRGIVVIHQMAKQEGNEKEFLKELEQQLLKGAREKPENLMG